MPSMAGTSPDATWCNGNISFTACCLSPWILCIATCPSSEFFSRLTCVLLPNVWVAVPFGQELGTLQTTLSAVVKGLSTNSRRSQKELTRSLATERESSEPETWVEDPEQRPDREVIEGTGAPSSRDGAGNEPPPRTVESSVSADQPPREQSDDADMGDPESDRKRPRVGWGGNGDKESQDQRLRWRRKRFRREESP